MSCPVLSHPVLTPVTQPGLAWSGLAVELEALRLRVRQLTDTVDDERAQVIVSD